MTDNTALSQELEAIYDRCKIWPELTADGQVALLELRNLTPRLLVALRTPAPAPVVGEPVAYRFDHEWDGPDFGVQPLTDADKAAGWTETPLYASPQSPPAPEQDAVEAPAADEVREMVEKLHRLHELYSIGGTTLTDAADMLVRLTSQPLADNETPSDDQQAGLVPVGEEPPILVSDNSPFAHQLELRPAKTRVKTPSDDRHACREIAAAIRGGE